ncbi:maleylpyruvate isomerase family mycothiol-dependent enzyme [Brachybacterium tyrofermentans]|uniref:maleylpyruvate isomerase family mycothiol-dependent enzyme n=1 Tax=Brachybacterium tyrofermentans TaxID=47848 RepID=UPI003FD4966F
MSTMNLWPLIQAERVALGDVLGDLSRAQWQAPTMCDAWTVQDLVGHLTAGSRTGTLPWLANMVAARFDTDRHNQRLLEKHRGVTPEDTLQRFRGAVSTTTAPLRSQEGALGEIIVHTQDIGRPLGIALVPSREAAEVVAAFFARTDFAVNSRSLAAGLHLEATDGPFRAGNGPDVAGGTLELVLAMAGRPTALDHLEGAGIALLRERMLRN